MFQEAFGSQEKDWSLRKKKEDDALGHYVDKVVKKWPRSVGKTKQKTNLWVQ